MELETVRTEQIGQPDLCGRASETPSGDYQRECSSWSGLDELGDKLELGNQGVCAPDDDWTGCDRRTGCGKCAVDGDVRKEQSEEWDIL